MNKYQIQLTIDNSNTPYIPTGYIINFDLWKKYIAPTLIDIGFIHIGDAMVLGNDNMAAEFILIKHIPPEHINDYNNVEIHIKKIN